MTGGGGGLLALPLKRLFLHDVMRETTAGKGVPVCSTTTTTTMFKTSFVAVMMFWSYLAL